MYILSSPAKQMRSQSFAKAISKPVYLEDAKVLVQKLKTLSPAQLSSTYKLSPKLGQEVYDYYQGWEEAETYPALYLYSGILYQYLDVASLDAKALSYLDQHLRILSGLYGVLKPRDAISVYRLEMGAKVQDQSMYAYWKNKLYLELNKADWLLNLASVEYFKSISKYLQDEVVINVDFKKADLKSAGVYAKMARGAMIRFLAQNQIENLEDIRKFRELGFSYSQEHSTDNRYCFLRHPD